MKKLPARLKAIAECIENGALVADIGTDHGMLPVYLAQTGTANRIIASDISAGSLGAASRLAAKYNVADKIEIMHTPGLSAIKSGDVDTVIIAGVGGETIISIIKDASRAINDVINKKLKLVLQPQTKHELLCDYLISCGLIIKEEKTVLDRRREYKILSI